MSGKWPEIDSPEMPAREFADQVLGDRLAKVVELLPLAALRAEEDLEYVHQLRVSCRRASAALRIFRPLLTKKTRKLKSWLTEIRDAAGPARDYDVLLERLSNSSQEIPGGGYIIERLEAERLEAQQDLVRTAEHAQEKQLSARFSPGLSAGKSSPQLSIAQFACQALHDVGTAFLQRAEQPDASLAEMHQLRIAGKRLRYTIEHLGMAFSPALREEVYPQITHLQGLLGKINDHATAQRLFQTWLAELPASGIAADLARAVVAEHETALELSREFHGWWNQERIAHLASLLIEIIGAGEN